MKWLVLITTVLIIYAEALAPIQAVHLRYDPYMEQVYKDHCTINTNLVELQYYDEIRTRSEVFHLIQPVLEIYLRKYKENFALGDSLSYALSCIFVSESSNGRGHSARSTLWLEYNNPFGLTTNRHSNAVTKMSWEMIRGRRMNMYRTFRTYRSLKEAVDSLMWDYLLKSRYERQKTATTVKGFLYDLYKSGYMTNRYWPRFAYNEIYLKAI